MDNITFNDNTVLGSGLYLLADNGGDITNDVIARRNIITNGIGGFYISNTDGGIMNTITLEENILSNGSGSGIAIFATDSAIASIHINNNVTGGYAGQGIVIGASGVLGGINAINLDGNTVTGSVFGLQVSSALNAVIGPVIVSNHTAIGSTDAGALFLASNGGDITSVSLTDSVIRDGGSVSTYGALTFIATNNNSIMGNVRVQNVTVTANQRDGVYVREGNSFNGFTGLLDFGGGGISVGDNSFYGNGLSNAATYDDFRAYGGTFSVLARQNWWGQAGGPIAGQVSTVGGGAISTTSPLAADPN